MEHKLQPAICRRSSLEFLMYHHIYINWRWRRIAKQLQKCPVRILCSNRHLYWWQLEHSNIWIRESLTQVGCTHDICFIYQGSMWFYLYILWLSTLCKPFLLVENLLIIHFDFINFFLPVNLELMVWNIVIVVHIFAWSNNPNDSYRNRTH